MVIFKFIRAIFKQRLFILNIIQHPYQSNLMWQRGDQILFSSSIIAKTGLNVCKRLPEGAKLFKAGCQLFIHGRLECFRPKIEVKFAGRQFCFERFQGVA